MKKSLAASGACCKWLRMLHILWRTFNTQQALLSR